MEDEEQEQLNDIHREVEGSHAQLGKIDERTRNIERHIESVSENVEDNANDINDLESDVKRNTTVINAVTVGLSGVALWAADKITRFNPF